MEQGLSDGFDGHNLLLHAALHRHQSLFEALDGARKLLNKIMAYKINNFRDQFDGATVLECCTARKLTDERQTNGKMFL